MAPALRYVDFPGVGRLSQLVMGCIMIHPEKMDYSSELLDTYVELGGNTFDTAHIYGLGNSERALGEWIRRRGNRDQVYIITKGAHPYQGNNRRVRPEFIVSDLNESLERLGVETVDLYLLHRDDPEYPVGPLVECLNEQKRAGKVKAFGGSNWSNARLQEANDYARAHGLEGFTLSSPNLALAVPNEARWAGCISVYEEDLHWYRQNRFPLFSWSSQAGGFFTGRFAPEQRENEEMVRVYYNDGNWERLRRAEELGRRKGVSANHIALAWVLNQKGFPCYALIGPLAVSELRDSLRAADLVLTDEEMDWLNVKG